MSTPTIAKDAADLARRVITEFDDGFEMSVGLKEDAESLLEKCHDAKIDAALVAGDAVLAAISAADLLAGLKWAIRMMQGESGAGDSYWDQFPEYVAACKALKRAEGL